MVNKKIILSILVLGCVATMAGAGTFAFFDDSAVVEDNTITAGTLTLGTPVLTNFEITNIAPGDADPAAQTLSLTNGGTIDGHLYADITATGESGMSDLVTTLNNAAMTDGASIDLGVMTAGSTKDITIGYDFSETGFDQNLQQGQVVTYDITYHLVQDI